MKNKKIWLGMLVMTLVFGMMVVGCDNGATTLNNDDDDKFFNELGLTKTPPGASILEDFELNLSEYNRIINAGGDGFQGWKVDEFNDLIFVWSNRSNSHFNAVANVLCDLFGEDSRGENSAVGNGYMIRIFTETCNDGGGIFQDAPGGVTGGGIVKILNCDDWPAGTLVLWKFPPSAVGASPELPPGTVD